MNSIYQLFNLFGVRMFRNDTNQIQNLEQYKIHNIQKYLCHYKYFSKKLITAF